MGFRDKKSKLNHKQAKLIVFCGLPGSGKTTLAKKLAAETGAVRLCPDEWMTDLGIDLFDAAMRDKIEKRLWKLARELLKSRLDVIVENGLWSRRERDEKRQEAEKLGVITEMHYLDVPFDELLRRIEIRSTSGDYATVPVSKEQMEEYAKLFQPPDETELKLFTKAITRKVS